MHFFPHPEPRKDSNYFLVASLGSRLILVLLSHSGKIFESLVSSRNLSSSPNCLQAKFTVGPVSRSGSFLVPRVSAEACISGFEFPFCFCNLGSVLACFQAMSFKVVNYVFIYNLYVLYIQVFLLVARCDFGWSIRKHAASSHVSCGLQSAWKAASLVWIWLPNWSQIQVVRKMVVRALEIIAELLGT